MADRNESKRLNVTLAPEHAEKLARMAEQDYTQEGTLARSLLSRAIDEADVDGRSMVELLNGIPEHSSAPYSAASRREPARRSHSTTCKKWHASS